MVLNKKRAVIIFRHRNTSDLAARSSLFSGLLPYREQPPFLKLTHFFDDMVMSGNNLLIFFSSLLSL